MIKSHLMPTLDMVLQLSLISKLSAAIFDRANEFLFRHVVEQHINERS